MMTAEYPTVVKHRMQWFVWAGGQKMPHTAMMRGQWGWDVKCACGWETRTGGATRGYVDQLVWAHKNGWDS